MERAQVAVVAVLAGLLVAAEAQVMEVAEGEAAVVEEKVVEVEGKMVGRNVEEVRAAVTMTLMVIAEVVAKEMVVTVVMVPAVRAVAVGVEEVVADMVVYGREM